MLHAPKEIQQSEARPEEQTFDRDVRDTDQPQGWMPVHIGIAWEGLVHNGWLHSHPQYRRDASLGQIGG